MFTKARLMPQENVTTADGPVPASQFFRADSFWACAVKKKFNKLFFYLS